MHLYLRAQSISVMIVEAVSIILILGGCAAAAFFAKSKFQPEIESHLLVIDAEAIEVSRNPRKD